METKDDMITALEELYQKWLEETIFHSRTDLILGNENFLKIVEYGNDAVPFIYYKLKTDSRSYLLAYALNMIFPNVITTKEEYSELSDTDLNEISSITGYKDLWLKILDEVYSNNSFYG